jgi:hypothetical protein
MWQTLEYEIEIPLNSVVQNKYKVLILSDNYRLSFPAACAGGRLSGLRYYGKKADRKSQPIVLTQNKNPT